MHYILKRWPRDLLDLTYKTPLSSVFLTLEGKRTYTPSRNKPTGARFILTPRSVPDSPTPPLASEGARYMSSSRTVESILPLAAMGAAADSFPAPFTGGSSCLSTRPSRQRALATPMLRSALDSPTPRAREHSRARSGTESGGASYSARPRAFMMSIWRRFSTFAKLTSGS